MQHPFKLIKNNKKYNYKEYKCERCKESFIFHPLRETMGEAMNKAKLGLDCNL